MNINLSKEQINQKVVTFLNGNSKKATDISKKYGVRQWRSGNGGTSVLAREELELEIYQLKSFVLEALKDFSVGFEEYNPESLFSDTRIVYEDEQRGIVYLTFDYDAVRRPSLYPEEYPDGIENIVLLLTNGYKCYSTPPTGTWHGRATEGWAERKPNKFLWEAIEKYNATSKYGCVASLERQYKK